MDDYFDEFLKGINNAWKVTLSNWKLYEGLVSDLDLSSEVPAQPFKIAISLSEAEGHKDCSGLVTIGEDVLEFDGATRKTTEQDLTELPEIVASGLDCQIVVECITTSRAPIYKEILTPIEIICFPKTRHLRDPSGSGFMQTDYDVYTRTALKIGDQIRYPDPHQGKTIDIYAKNVYGAVDLEDLSQPFRVLNCA